MDTWEERMAAKAAARDEAQRVIDAAERDAYWKRQKESWTQAYADTLTPESAAEEQSAVEANPVGCACTGGPRCCLIRYEARKRVLGK